MLSIKKFTYVPVYVDAVQVTEANMDDVAQWCEGKICVGDQESDGVPYIKVNVLRPQKVRQSMAFEGDWVIKVQGGHKVYTPGAFNKSFIPTP